MIPTLTAVKFERFMASGRTSPALCGCEDEAGRMAGEYVVKLRGAVGVLGLLNELFASALASHFAIKTPEPALIAIEPTLVEQIAVAQPAKAAVIRGSTGLNFGSRYVQGATTWPVDKSIPPVLSQRAADIFTFDALIQNPDRRHGNPNLLAVQDDLLIFDHEAAFSFLVALFPPPAPWGVEDQQYLTDHVFYRRLKSKEVDFTGFMDRLGSLSTALLVRIVADIPAEWNNDNVARIQRHLEAVRDHAADFAAAVRRFLV